jgi:hypothetical protein
LFWELTETCSQNMNLGCTIQFGASFCLLNSRTIRAFIMIHDLRRPKYFHSIASDYRKPEVDGVPLNNHMLQMHTKSQKLDVPTLKAIFPVHCTRHVVPVSFIYALLHCDVRSLSRFLRRPFTCIPRLDHNVAPPPPPAGGKTIPPDANLCHGATHGESQHYGH